MGGLLGGGGIGGLLGGAIGAPDPDKTGPPTWDVLFACPANALFNIQPFCLPCMYYAFGEVFSEWNYPGIPPGIGPVAGTYPRLRQHLVTEFTAQKIWTATILWEDNILPALQLMTEQLSAVAMQQMQIVGEFLDAKHQLETQQTFQRLTAEAHKDYHPSIGVCEFGSAAKSLAASERKGELDELVLARRAQDRALGNANTAGATGQDSDLESRIRQFRAKFCDPADNNNGLAYLCEHDQTQTLRGPIGASSKLRMNKDIDYVRTIDTPWTIQADFSQSKSQPTDNEEEILALGANLYSNEVFYRPPSKSLESRPTSGRLNALQKYYLDMRAILAKRSVAENSFNAITAMKLEGTPGSKDYIYELVRQLGVPNNEVKKLLGDRPSYWAQMEVLTKKVFQNPDFYTNLYDKPANVDRKGVAIQAIGLMQKFDLYKSYLRNEENLSVLLELEVENLQKEVENEFNRVRGGGTAAPK